MLLSRDRAATAPSVVPSSSRARHTAAVVRTRTAAVVAVFVTASSGQTNLAIIIGIFSAAFFSRVMC